MSKVVNVKVNYIRKNKEKKYNDLKEWCNDVDKNLYIGRKGVVFIKNDEGKKERFPKCDSVWANPFKISDKLSRDEVISKYREYIVEKIEKGEVNILDLKGKNLGCWCHPESCHGDVLVELLKSYE